MGRPRPVGEGPAKLPPPHAGDARPGPDLPRGRRLHVAHEAVDREPLESLDQLSHRDEAFAFAFLTNNDQRGGGNRNPRLETREEPNASVDVSDAAQAAADALEAAEHIVDRFAVMPLMGKRQHFSNAADCDASIVHAVDVAVEDPRQMPEKGVCLTLQNRNGCREPQHGASSRSGKR